MDALERFVLVTAGIMCVGLLWRISDNIERMITLLQRLIEATNDRGR